MFDLKSIQRGVAMKAPRILLYGVPGIGKTSFAAGAPDPIFIMCEDGLGSLDVAHFPLAKKISDVTDAIASLDSDEHAFTSVVVDSLDWCESLIIADIEQKHDPKDLGYGKGAVLVAEKWREILAGLNHLRLTRNMVVILLAHSQIKRFESPETEGYDRFMIKLQERSSAIVREWADAVLFCNYKTVIKKDDLGFGKTSSRGISSGERLLFTSERPAYLAKNRFNLPESIPLSWDSLQNAINHKE